MAVGQARHEAVGCPLAHVAGREDDSLRVVVAHPENRTRELVRVARVGVQRRQIEFARVDDSPVAALYFGVGIAEVHDLRRNLLAAVDDLIDVILRPLVRSSSSGSTTTAVEDSEHGRALPDKGSSVNSLSPHGLNAGYPLLVWPSG